MRTRISFSTVLSSLLLFLALPYYAAAQIQFRHFSTPEGLPNAVVDCISQDEAGFIWLGTSNGLYRYDGTELLPYKNNAQSPYYLPSNKIVCHAADHKGHLWIGTQEGLCRLDLHSGKVRHLLLAGVDKQRINSICVTRNGHIYVGTIRGFARYDAVADSLLRIETAQTDRNSLGGVNIQSVIEDHNGDLLIGSLEYGVYRYSPNRRVFTHYDGCTSPTVYTLCAASADHVYAGTADGVYSLTFSSSGSLVSSRRIASIPNVYSVTFHRGDNLLYIANDHGLYTLSPDETLSSCILPTFVRRFFTDATGTLWLCTSDDGVYIEEASSLRFKTLFDGSIRSVCTDAAGIPWVSLVRGAMGGSHALLPAKTVMSVSSSRTTGQLFLSCWNDGLFTATSDGRVTAHYSSAHSSFVKQNSVRKVLEDSRGNWWVATNRGLGVRYANGKEHRIRLTGQAGKLLSGDIPDVVEDADGSLWLLTPSQGLVHLYGDLSLPASIKARVYDVSNGLVPVNSPLCLHLDPQGNLWLGTDGGGLCLYNRHADRFESVHQQWNLTCDMVSSLESDAYGSLWIGTNSGLTRLQVSGEGRGCLRVYTVVDGLPDNFFTPRASCHHGNQLYFGTTQGLVTFVPEPLAPISNPPHNVAVTGVSIDGRPASCPPIGPDTIVVPASASTLTIRFSSLVYHGQHQCSHSYRLLGIDSQWHTAPHRTAHFAHLAPGEYVFEMRATDDAGRWSPVRRVVVVVEPPLWLTWWAKTIYVLLALLAIVWLIRKLRSRMMTRNRLHLQFSDDGSSQVVVEHKDDAVSNDTTDEGAIITGDTHQLTFEIRNLDFSSADEAFLREAVESVNRHLSDSSYSITQLTEELCTSRTTLFKRLKTLTGMNASNFIADIRLRAACRILSQTSADSTFRISDLAYSVGFNDPKYFSVCFKKKYGVTPRDYIKNSTPESSA